MGNVATVMRRELGAYFLSPVAYLVAAIFLLAAGLAFGLGNFTPGGEASLRPLLETWMVVILVCITPVLTMRLLAEEVRGGTIEMLMTAPVSESDVVFGKFFGAFVFLLILLIAPLIYAGILSAYGRLDLSLLLCHYIGVLLLGGLYLAVGLFFSACTRHQIIAVLLSLLVLVLMTFAAAPLAQTVEGLPRVLLQHLSVHAHYRVFVQGLLDVNHVAFFVTTTFFFLFVSTKWLEARRWR